MAVFLKTKLQISNTFQTNKEFVKENFVCASREKSLKMLSYASELSFYNNYCLNMNLKHCF